MMSPRQGIHFVPFSPCPNFGYLPSMTATPSKADIIVADVYCIACGHALRLRAVDHPCPGCGTDVQAALASTLLAGGHRHVRRIGRAMMWAAAFNIGLGVG